MGRRKQSKRQRKQKDRHSLKHKGRAPAELPEANLLGAGCAGGAAGGVALPVRTALLPRIVTFHISLGWMQEY